MQTLDELVREAETYLHRRAAHGERDRGCYRVGAALEPCGGHLLDDVALSGLDHLGAFGLLLLVQVALANPGQTLSELMGILFTSEAGEEIRAWGVWSRGVWLRNLYVEETVNFLLTKKAQDPAQRWRKDKVTARQQHLLRELSRALDINVPGLANRGEAFDWIKANGGNPRFREPPPMPALPSGCGDAA